MGILNYAAFNPQVFWAILIVLFVVVEAATAGIATIWFAAGALCAVLASFLCAPFWLQVAIFVSVSLLLLVFTRPIVKRFLLNRKERTNADMNVGKNAVVTERIDAIDGTGYVKLGSIYWGAISDDGEPIETGSIVTVTAIKGNRFIVKADRQQNNDTQP